MKYFFATVACGCLIGVYAVVGALLNWKHGGGALPMILLFAAVAATWRGIIKDRSVVPHPSQTKPDVRNASVRVVNYYYRDSTGQVAGPDTQEKLKDLFASRAITEATLVITEGEAEWRTYADHFSPAWSPPPPPIPQLAPPSERKTFIEARASLPTTPAPTQKPKIRPFVGVALISSAFGFAALFTDNPSFGFKVGAAAGEILGSALFALPLFLIWKWGTRTGRSSSQTRGFNVFSSTVFVLWLLFLVVVPTLEKHEKERVRHEEEIRFEEQRARSKSFARTVYPDVADHDSPLGREVDRLIAVYGAAENPILVEPDAPLLIARAAANNLGISPGQR